MTTVPIAICTVKFSHPLLGKSVAGLVQKIAGTNPNEGRYIEKRYFYDGPAVELGQASRHHQHHVRILNSLESSTFAFYPFIRLHETYGEILVTSHLWRLDHDVEASSRRLIIKTTQKFAESLRDAYKAAQRKGVFPEYVPIQTVQT